ncbi:MAG: methionine--tRNA ligase subunit beta [Candidatus Paceibacterota bacterium]|jgi:methionyl-tRNA synthetase|nr:methionine--tRNA ligase subunit beta [Candidatus Paceibacterota bacterium]
MENINFDEFKKVDLRVAKILKAERVEGSDKLLRLEVDLGEEQRQILAGIGKEYEPESLVNREIIVVANLEPRTMMGLESQGMLLAASIEGKPVILTTDKEVPPGSEIR